MYYLFRSIISLWTVIEWSRKNREWIKNLGYFELLLKFENHFHKEITFTFLQVEYAAGKFSSSKEIIVPWGTFNSCIVSSKAENSRFAVLSSTKE